MWNVSKNVVKPFVVVSVLMLLLSLFIAQATAAAVLVTPIGKTIDVTSGETFVLEYEMRFNETAYAGFFGVTFYWDNNESLPDASKWNFTYQGFVAKFTDGTGFSGPITVTVWKAVPPGYPSTYKRYSVTISESYGEAKNGDFWVNVTMRAAGQSGGIYVNHTAPSDQNITCSGYVAEATIVPIPEGVCTIHVKVPPVHDVAIIGVSLFRTIVGEGVPTAFTEIYVTAENQGNLTETFDVTAYYDSRVIVTQTGVTLPAGENTTLTFIWYTSALTKGRYTIKAVASTVSGELDTADNTFVNGPFIVTIAGDVDGDGEVYIGDLGMLGRSWRKYRGDPKYIPNADIDCDGEVYVGDLGILGRNWRKRDC